MTIGERVLSRIDELKMSQKEFSEKTGIPQSTISEWKRKGNNPSSDKIMIICNVLKVTPEWLLSGVDSSTKNKKKPDWFVIDKNSELGEFIDNSNRMNEKMRYILKGYVDALMSIKRNTDKKE